MPRSGTFPYTYTLPSVYLAVSGQPILASSSNTTLQDVQSTFNTVQPINFGGTGASTAAQAAINLGVGTSDSPTFAALTVTGNVNAAGLIATSTDAGATGGPDVEAYRNSASAAVNDILARDLYTGQNSTPAKKQYAHRQAVIISPTAGAEYGSLDDYAMVSGTEVLGLSNQGTNVQINNAVQGYATTATAAGTTTLTIASKQTQYFTGSTTQTVVLPVVSAGNMALGHTFKIVNNSTTGDVTVQSSGANAIAVLAPGTQAVFTCILTSGTTAASWSASLGGGALAYQCRAWVNFNGTGTVAIRASGNVSSITDNGTGDYKVNFTTAMPDANYAVLSTNARLAGANSPVTNIEIATSPTTSAVRIRTANSDSNVASDPTIVNVAIIR